MPNTRKILIEDDCELRGALTEQLSLYEEYEAVAAENGNKGVQAARAGQIDLVIMDVGLPDIDGREAVRILRRKRFQGADHHAHGPRHRFRHHPRPRIGSQ